MTQHPTIAPRPGVLDITPYVGGAAHADGANRVIKLSANENPLGPCRAAVDACIAGAEKIAVYPDGDHGDLRRAIGEVHGIDPARIVCGAGSDEIIALLCKAYTGPGDEVLYSAHAFLMYRISGLSAGASPVAVPEKDLTVDIDAMIGAMTYRTRLVFLANPNNPTGTMVPMAGIERLADALPPRAMLVLDSAYAEYIDGYDGGIALVEARENVVMTRTFSKIYGLGALRLGWCFAPAHVVAVLNRVRGPFNVSATALAAGEAAIRDHDWIMQCVAENARCRTLLTEALEDMGFAVTPSHGNFILVHIGPKAADIDAFLKTRGILIRQMAGYGLPEHLRISIGTEADCHSVIEAFGDWKTE